jgi:hypothetical protein
LAFQSAHCCTSVREVDKNRSISNCLKLMASP